MLFSICSVYLVFISYFSRSENTLFNHICAKYHIHIRGILWILVAIDLHKCQYIYWDVFGDILMKVSIVCGLLIYVYVALLGNLHSHYSNPTISWHKCGYQSCKWNRISSCLKWELDPYKRFKNFLELGRSHFKTHAFNITENNLAFARMFLMSGFLLLFTIFYVAYFPSIRGPYGL